MYCSLLKINTWLERQNAPKIVWRPGSIWTSWGAYSALTDPLAGFSEGKEKGKEAGTGWERRSPLK